MSLFLLFGYSKVFEKEEIFTNLLQNCMKNESREAEAEARASPGTIKYAIIVKILDTLRPIVVLLS